MPSIKKLFNQAILRLARNALPSRHDDLLRFGVGLEKKTHLLTYVWWVDRIMFEIVSSKHAMIYRNWKYFAVPSIKKLFNQAINAENVKMNKNYSSVCFVMIYRSCKYLAMLIKVFLQQHDRICLFLQER